MRNVISALAVLVLLSGCATLHDASLPTGTIQKGTLANKILVRDAMFGAVSQAAIEGLKKLDSFEPYVVELPQGEVGSRFWREKWFLKDGDKKYEINLFFKEDGHGGADWVVEKDK